MPLLGGIFGIDDLRADIAQLRREVAVLAQPRWNQQLNPKENYAMNKKDWIVIFIIPNLRSLAAWLKRKDANSTGADDEAAKAIDAAIVALETYLTAE